MALESISQSAEEAICDLLKSLDEACIVSPAMMEQVSIINSWIELLYMEIVACGLANILNSSSPH